MVENILFFLPAVDLLRLQRVNKKCENVISTTWSCQAKLFLDQDALNSEARKSGANEFRWNPFLVKYGVPLRSKIRTHEHRIKITSEDLQKLDRPKASCKLDRPRVFCKDMFVAYPTMLEFRVFLKLPSGVDLLHLYTKKDGERKEGERMEFLKAVDGRGIDTIIIVAGY